MRRIFSNRGVSAVIVLVVIIVVLAVGSGGYYVWHRNSAHHKTKNTTPANQKTQLDGTSEKQSDSYTGWKSYSNSVYGVSFKYPSDWKVQENALDPSGSANKNEYEINLQWNKDVKYNGTLSIEVLDENIDAATAFYDSSITPAMGITKTPDQFKGRQSMQYVRSDPRDTQRFLVGVGAKTYVISSMDTALNQQAGTSYWNDFNKVVDSLQLQ